MNKIEPKNNKKAAIVCYGTRIALESKNVRSVDLVYIREYLLNVLGREQVDYVSLKTEKEEGLDYYKDIDKTNLNDYDEVYIYNCTLNPFGGIFKWYSLQTFVELYKFNGDIYYILLDPKMPAVDFAKYISRHKNKNKTYTFKADNESGEFKIDPEILDNWTEKVWNRINVAYGGIDYEKYVALWNKNRKGGIKELNSNVDWFNMWLFEYYAVNEELDLKLKNYKKIENPYDLVYFGNNRQNERNKVIKRLYDIPEFKKYCIGFDPELENTDIDSYVRHDELFKLIGEKCLATVVVGDNLHNGNERTPRFFEAMLLDVVAFINIDFDPNKSYIKDEFLKNFIYVSDKEELKDKINKIKADKSLYAKIIKLERKEILEGFGKFMLPNDKKGDSNDIKTLYM